MSTGSSPAIYPGASLSGAFKPGFIKPGTALMHPPWVFGESLPFCQVPGQEKQHVSGNSASGPYGTAPYGMQEPVRQVPAVVRGARAFTLQPSVLRPAGQLTTAGPGFYRQLSKYTLDNCSQAVKWLNLWMGTESFIAAVFHGGYKVKGLPAQRNRIRGLFEPSRYTGLWPGIYKPGSPVRKWLIDAPLIASCLWDGGNAFLKYASAFASPGTGLAAAVAELINGFAFSVRFSEPIMYGVMDKTMQILAKFTPIARLPKLPPAVKAGLSPKASAALVKKMIPFSYRATRTLVGGAFALFAIEAIIKTNSAWVTPLAAKTLGPRIDGLLKRFCPGMAAKVLPNPEADSLMAVISSARGQLPPKTAFSGPFPVPVSLSTRSNV